MRHAGSPAFAALLLVAACADDVAPSPDLLAPADAAAPSDLGLPVDVAGAPDAISALDLALVDGALSSLLGKACKVAADCGSPSLTCNANMICALACSAQQPCPSGTCAGGACPPCGDGYCDARERQNAALCPADCSTTGKARSESVMVTNPRSGVALPATLFFPMDASATKRYPAVALVPGGSGGGDAVIMQGLPDELVARGYIAMVFDLDGRGKAGGTEDYCGFTHQDGLKALIDTLGKRPEVAAGRVGLQTSSYGVTCGSGVLARHGASLPVKLLVDWEGPADRNDTGHCDAANTGHITHDCKDEAWWSEREAATHIRSVTVPYIRVQATKDHAQPDNAHCVLMINSATSTGHGGMGKSPWTIVNDETLNAPNKTYSAQAPPKYLADSKARLAEYVDSMMKKYAP